MVQAPCHRGAIAINHGLTMTHAPSTTTPVSAPDEGPQISDGLAGLAWRAFWALGALALVSALMVLGGNLYGERLLRANLSTSAEPLQIVIGNDVLDVPENMFRHADQRVAGITNRAELKVHWPERSGYRTDLADAFSDTSPETVQTVLISIARRQWLLDMAGRLDLVYRKAIDPAKPPRSVHGLTAVALDPAHGYVDETLYYAPSATSGLPVFIARCNEPAAGREALLLACETDLFFGETLEVRVRFPSTFLADWAKFSAELDALLESFLVTP